MALGGCVDRKAQEQAKVTQTIVTNPLKIVSVQPAQTQNVAETLEITGQVVTTDDTQVGPKQSGRLVRVYIHDGDNVVAGQVIAEQDSTQLSAQYRQTLASVSSARSQLAQAMNNAALAPSKSLAAVRQAQAQVASAQQTLRSAQANYNKVHAGARPEERLQADAQVRSAKANLDKSQKDLERMSALVTQGAASQSDLDSARWNYQSALSTYQTAVQNQAMQQNGARSEDLAIAQAAVDQARDGIRNAEEGLKAAKANQGLDVLLNDAVRTAQAQVQAAQAQADAARSAVDDTKIRAPFSGKVAGKPLQAGAVASPGTSIARIVGAQGAYFEGQVSEESVRFVETGHVVTVTLDALPGRSFVGAVQNVSGQGSDVGRLFSVRVGLGSNLSDVRPGMFARGSVQLRSVAGAVVVPIPAVVRKGDKDVVFIANGDVAKAATVTKGITQGSVVQVIGIKAGDPVIVQGQTALEDGSKIEVDKKSATPASPTPGS